MTATLSKVHFLGWANQSRLRLVEELAHGGETTVRDLVIRLKISQPRVSWHLQILRRAQIVKTRRSGREVLCSLDVESIRRHQESLRRLLDGVGAVPSAPEHLTLNEMKVGQEGT